MIIIKKTALGVGLSILFAYSAFHFFYVVFSILSTGFYDFYIFWNQAISFLETNKLYPFIDNLNAYNPGTAVYKFPPLYAMLLLPLIKLGIKQNIFIYHWMFQILIYLFSIVLCSAISKKRNIYLWVSMFFIMAFIYYPFFETLVGLQVETFIFMSIILCLYLTEKKKYCYIGIILGFCTMLKIYPMFLMAYFFLKKKWPVVIWFMITLVLIIIFSVVIIGFQESYNYFFKILPYLLKETALVSMENLSICRYLQEMFSIDPQISIKISKGISFFLLFLSCLIIYMNKKQNISDNYIKLEYCIFIPLLLLYPQNSWSNYQLYLLLPIFIVLTHKFKFKNLKLISQFLVIIAFVGTLFSENYPGYILHFIPVRFSLHNFFINFRIVSTLFVWLTLIFLLFFEPRWRDFRRFFRACKNFWSRLLH